MACTYDADEDPNNLIKKVSVDKLTEEKKKLPNGFQDVDDQFSYYEDIYMHFQQQLMHPQQFSNGISNKINFFSQSNLKKDLIIRLCDEMEQIFMRDPIMLKLKWPIKIFGNINGNLSDLMRFFYHSGSPIDIFDNNQTITNDIEATDYLFLGDYVNRGNRSLETILLLFSLKLRFPDKFYMLRGHQEDRKQCKIYGLADECIDKLGDDPNNPQSVFCRITRVFEYMPLAALINESYFCAHGGIGTMIESIEELQQIQRPLEI